MPNLHKKLIVRLYNVGQSILSSGCRLLVLSSLQPLCMSAGLADSIIEVERAMQLGCYRLDLLQVGTRMGKDFIDMMPIRGYHPKKAEFHSYHTSLFSSSETDNT